jgi:hypothetical protein
MHTPPIAHFGTTICESPPAVGTAQREAPIEGALASTLEFLETLGFVPGLENFYEGVGRQYIWRRGKPSDVDYVEQDNFTSYTAAPRPRTPGPRVGDTVFRVTHRQPRDVLRRLVGDGLAEVERPAEEEDFLAGDRDWLLVRAPNGQCYEFGPTQPTPAENHSVYVWTPSPELDAASANYERHFGLLKQSEREDFHGIGSVRRLARSDPGVTIGLLHDPGAGLAPRWTEDIFQEAGYSHFRLGAPDKSATEGSNRQAFPPAGDVAFVYFENSYLELVQI